MARSTTTTRSCTTPRRPFQSRPLTWPSCRSLPIPTSSARKSTSVKRTLSRLRSFTNVLPMISGNKTCKYFKSKIQDFSCFNQNCSKILMHDLKHLSSFGPMFQFIIQGERLRQGWRVWVQRVLHYSFIRPRRRPMPDQAVGRFIVCQVRPSIFTFGQYFER